MSFKTHLNLIMLRHEDVGGMWKVFRVISYIILQNTPAVSICTLLHSLNYFICSSLIPLFTSFSPLQCQMSKSPSFEDSSNPSSQTSEQFQLNTFLFFNRTWVFWQLSWVISQNLYDLYEKGEKESQKLYLPHLYHTVGRFHTSTQHISGIIYCLSHIATFVWPGIDKGTFGNLRVMRGRNPVVGQRIIHVLHIYWIIFLIPNTVFFCK